MLETISLAKTINLMTSNICNGHCACCRYDEIYTDNFSVMDPVLWNKLCMDLYQINMSRYTIQAVDNKMYQLEKVIVHLGFLDEPLCDPLIIKRVADLKRVGCTVGIVTNCSLLTSNMLEQLYTAGVTEFYLSLLSAEKQVFESITSLNFDTVVGNIKHALQYLADKNVIIRINAPLDKIEDKESYFNVFGNEIVNNHVFFNMKDNRVKSYKEEKINWGDGCYRHIDGRNKDNGCQVGMCRFVIMYNGDVPICNLDCSYTPIGNIKDSSVYGMIKKQINRVIEINKKEPKCCTNCYASTGVSFDSFSDKK